MQSSWLAGMDLACSATKLLGTLVLFLFPYEKLGFNFYFSSFLYI